MTDLDEAKRAVKEALTRLGKGLPGALGLDARRDGQRVWVRCPWHSDTNPSASLSVGPEGTLRLHCFPCDRTGDALDLVAHARGLDIDGDFHDVLIEGARVTGLWRVEAELCDEAGVERARERRPVKLPPPPEPEAPRAYPPAAEIAAVWKAARHLVDYRKVREYEYETVVTDREAYDELVTRGVSPEQLVDLDACRVISLGDALPRWARFRGERHESHPWPDLGFKLLFPVFDARGAMRSVRARRVGPASHPDDPKAVPPVGFTPKGLVLACAQMRRILETGTDAGAPFVIVTEGESDFAAAATQWSDAAEDPAAVVGLFSGAWSADVAARIPDGLPVVIWTDEDGAGDRYADDVNESLGHRCPVRRGQMPETRRLEP